MKRLIVFLLYVQGSISFASVYDTKKPLLAEMASIDSYTDASIASELLSNMLRITVDLESAVKQFDASESLTEVVDEVMTLPNGNVGRYTGTINSKNLPHTRRGIIEYIGHKNGMTSYSGSFYEGLPHGFGTLNWISKGIYVGEMREGKMMGKGSYMNGSKDLSFEGTFWNDCWARGTMTEIGSNRKWTQTGEFCRVPKANNSELKRIDRIYNGIDFNPFSGKNTYFWGGKKVKKSDFDRFDEASKALQRSSRNNTHIPPILGPGEHGEDSSGCCCSIM